MMRDGGGGGMPPEKRPRMAGPPSGGGGMMGVGGGPGLMGAPGGARPGKVVSCRGLPDAAVEADLLDACGQFGAISYIQITGRGNALLEFEGARSAEECVNYNQTTDIFVLQTPVYFSFAPMDEIPRRGLESAVPSCVVVVYVANARYPISVDVVTAICKPIAAVQRIIITRRAGIVVLIELVDAETARTIKHRLNGCDIYSGCCTLKIEFSKLKRLNVVRNDQDQWDYTGPPGGAGRPGLLSDPTYPAIGGGRSTAGDEIGYDESGRPIFDDPYAEFAAPHPYSNNGSVGIPPSRGGGAPSGYPTRGMAAAPDARYGGGGGGHGGFGVGDYGGGGDPYDDRFRGGDRREYGGPMDFHGGGAPPYGDPYDRPPHRGASPPSSDWRGGGGGGGGRGYRDRSPPPPSRYGGMGGGGAADGTGVGQDNSVVMMYGLADRWNVDRIFNLCCLYGNVVAIKFLKNKTDSCMVQMGDPVAAERLIRSVNRARAFDKELQLSMSKKPYLEDMRTEPFPLADGSPAYRVFRDNRANRFLTPQAAAKNRLNPPGTTVYFFNVPTDFSEEMLNPLLEKNHLVKPIKLTVFEARENARTCAGTMEWEHTSDALEALVILNHESVNSPTSNIPFVMKLTFSGPHMPDRSQSARYADRGPRINGPQHIVGDRMDRRDYFDDDGGAHPGGGRGRGRGGYRGGSRRGERGGGRGHGRGR